MTTYRLDRLFAPRSVAVVGASQRENSVGRNILKNLKAAGFEGTIRLVNPKYAEIEGVRAIKNVASLPQTDLLVIASPPSTIPDVIAVAGASGCGAAVIVTSGLGKGKDRSRGLQSWRRAGTVFAFWGRIASVSRFLALNSTQVSPRACLHRVI